MFFISSNAQGKGYRITEYKTSTTDTQFSIELITTFLQATHAAVGCYAAPLSALTESVSKRSRIHDTSSVSTSNVFGLQFTYLTYMYITYDWICKLKCKYSIVHNIYHNTTAMCKFRLYALYKLRIALIERLISLRSAWFADQACGILISSTYFGFGFRVERFDFPPSFEFRALSFLFCCASGLFI